MSEEAGSGLPPTSELAIGPPGREPSAFDVIRVALADSVRHLLVAIPAAAQGVDPEGVHQARVGVRRVRSDLRTFEPFLDATSATTLRAELAVLADGLGRVRDFDVIENRLESILDTHPEIALADGRSVLESLAEQRNQARDELLDLLGATSTQILLERLVKTVSDRAAIERSTESFAVLLPLVGRRWKRVRRAVDRLPRSPSTDELHRVRILVKRFRYACVAVGPAFGKRAAKSATAAAKVQDTLGDLNDASMTRDWLSAAAASLGGAEAFAAGQMSQQSTSNAYSRLGEWRGGGAIPDPREAGTGVVGCDMESSKLTPWGPDRAWKRPITAWWWARDRGAQTSTGRSNPSPAAVIRRLIPRYTDGQW